VIQDPYTQVAALYFAIISLLEQILDISNKEAFTTLEKLTNITKERKTKIQHVNILFLDGARKVRSPNHQGTSCHENRGDEYGADWPLEGSLSPEREGRL
jgi:hypothetical protein